MQTRLEKPVAATLHEKGYEEFLPLYKVNRRWSDRVKQLEQPLFPGYLFCRLDPLQSLLPVLTTPGVIRILSAGRVPLEIPDREIDAIQSVVNSGIAAEPWPCLAAGDRVQIEFGPLAGMEGIVIRQENRYRIFVSVTLLQRGIAAEIERDWIRPIPSRLAILPGPARPLPKVRSA